MLVSLNWLKDFVDVPDDLQAFCDRLDLTGTGVEGVTRTGAGMEDVLIGYVQTCEPHPNSDHMHVCLVDVTNAESEPLQIVCGAPNIREGIKVAVATIGSVLPGDFKIKKSKLRGVESCGMICSERELGLGSDQSGIMVLPDDAPIGVPYMEWLGAIDTVLDLEITPNRPDCLSMKGFAREVGAMYHVPWHYEPPCPLPGPQNDEDVCELVSVEIDDPCLCPRYTARIIRGVKIGPSPEWLVKRITALGARPINNVVDISNYILFELGQPLHTFDLRAFPRGADGRHHVVVRAAEDDTTFTTLDGSERELTSDMTLITDGKRPVALAGVMGGLDSEVTETTTDILLESATFSTAHTSRTSRNLSLVSEASLRYERGVDATTCDEYSEIAAALIADLCGGTVCKGVVDVYPIKPAEAQLTLRPARLRAHIGADIDDAEQIKILTDLGCVVEGKPKDAALRVIAPTFRPDLTREIDLYEEVLRIWGMDRVVSTLPGGAHAGGRTLDQRRIELISQTMRACGLNETMTYSLVAAGDLERARIPKQGRGRTVEILNPMSEEQSVLRQSIIPGLLRSVAYNEARGVRDVQLFERGIVFGGMPGQKMPKERSLLAGVMCGSFNESSWNQSAVPIDFFDAKGVIETLARELCIPKLYFKVLDADVATWLQPGRAASVFSGGCELGWVGEIHPRVARAFDIEGAVAAFELDIAQLLASAQDMRPYVDVPIYPAIEMDLSIVVDEDVSAERILNCIKNAGKKGPFESVRLFDVYHDDKRIGANKKSLALRLIYRAKNRTLKSEEAEKAHAKIVAKLTKATGGQIRA